MQNIIDPIITNYKASDELQMNPIVTLVSTLAAGSCSEHSSCAGKPGRSDPDQDPIEVKHFAMSVPETDDIGAPGTMSKK
jgi:hypothetical protein